MITFPAYFLPSVEYIKAAFAKPSILVEVHEHFPKQTFRNRFNIYGANGLLSLSIPLEGRTNKTLTKDIKLSYNEPWNSRHWRSIQSAYNSSPFFEHYEHYFSPLFNKKYIYLLDLNLLALQQVYKAFKEPPKIITTEHFQEMPLEQELTANLKVNPYYQVFSNKHGYIPSLSVIDLLFHKGPEAKSHLLL